jgi:hypothetical protein
MEGYETVSRFWEEIYAGLVELFGLKIREPWTMQQFVMTVTALNEGCSLRQHLSGHIERVARLFAVGLEALVHQFFESDPDFNAATP